MNEGRRRMNPHVALFIGVTAFVPSIMRKDL